VARSLRAINWDESKHPRDNRGRFAEKGGARWATRVLSQAGARFADTGVGEGGREPQGRLQTGKGGLIDLGGLAKSARGRAAARAPEVPAKGTFERGPSSASSSAGGPRMAAVAGLKVGDRFKHLGAEHEVTGVPRAGRKAGEKVTRVPVKRVADGKAGAISIPGERVEVTSRQSDRPARGVAGGAAARMEAARERAGLGRTPGGTQVDTPRVPGETGGMTPQPAFSVGQRVEAQAYSFDKPGTPREWYPGTIERAEPIGDPSKGRFDLMVRLDDGRRVPHIVGPRGGGKAVRPAGNTPGAGEVTTPLDRQQAAIKLGTNFSGNPYSKLPTLEALTDDDFKALTPDQQDSVRFLASKLARQQTGEAGDRARALETRFGKWGQAGGAADVPANIQQRERFNRLDATQQTAVRARAAELQSGGMTTAGAWLKALDDNATAQAAQRQQEKAGGALPATWRSALAKIDASEVGKERGLHPGEISPEVRRKLHAAGLMEGREQSSALGKRDYLHLTPAGHEALKAADPDKYEQRRAAAATKAEKAAAKQAAEAERRDAARVKADAARERAVAAARAEGLDEQEAALGGVQFARDQKAKRDAEAAAQRETVLARGVPTFTAGEGSRFGGENGTAAGQRINKLTAALQKDGFTMEELRPAIAQQAKDYSDAMGLVDAGHKDVLAAEHRVDYLDTIAKAHPDEPAYRERLKAAKADQFKARTTASDRVRAARAAKDRFEQAVVDLYDSKGRRKTAAALKLPAPTTEAGSDTYRRDLLSDRLGGIVPAGATGPEADAARRAALDRLRLQDQAAIEKKEAERLRAKAYGVERDLPHASRDPERRAELMRQRNDLNAQAGQAEGRARDLNAGLRNLQLAEEKALADLETARPTFDMTGLDERQIAGIMTVDPERRAEVAERFRLANQGRAEQAARDAAELAELGAVGVPTQGESQEAQRAKLLQLAGKVSARTAKLSNEHTIPVPGRGDLYSANIVDSRGDRILSYDNHRGFSTGNAYLADNEVPFYIAAYNKNPDYGAIALHNHARAAMKEAGVTPGEVRKPPEDVRPEREQLQERLRNLRDRVRHVNDYKRKRDMNQTIIDLENRLDAIDVEERKAKVKEFKKGDLVKGLAGMNYEVVGTTKDGYLRVQRPDGKRASINPGSVEKVGAPATEMPSFKLPGTARREATADKVQAAQDALKAATTRAEGDAAIASMITIELRHLAEKLNVNIGGLVKADAQQRIVERAVGSRLNSAAIRDRGNFAGAAYLGGTGTPEVRAGGRRPGGQAATQEAVDTAVAGLRAATTRTEAEAALKGLSRADLDKVNALYAVNGEARTPFDGPTALPRDVAGAVRALVEQAAGRNQDARAIERAVRGSTLPFGSFSTPNANMTPSDRNGERVEVRARGESVQGVIVGQVGGVRTAGGSAGNSFFVVRHDDGSYQTYDTRVVHPAGKA
jgi:hypothetical protein